MDPKKFINISTRKAFGHLKGCFKNKIGEAVSTNDAIKRILICRPNHRLGNLLLLSPLVQELESIFPNSEIDLLVNHSCAIQLYQNYENVNVVIAFPKKPFKSPIKYIKTFIRFRSKNYDLAINAVKESCTGRLFTSISKAKFKFVGNGIADKKERHIAKQVIYSFREFLPSIGVMPNDAVLANLDLRLANEELIHGGSLVYDIVENAQPTICLYTHTIDTKPYTEAWWLDLYAHLQKAFPDVNIIEMLPKENSSKIGSKAPVLYSNDVRELAAMIANTDVFVGADSGVMHLASSSLTPTIGLFSATDTKKYRPYNEGSLAVNINEVEIDALIAVVKKTLYPNLNTSA
ncbi:glycosyltransferase family 9 protein [Maribacter sp. PR1]|uniref:Glycosyltransferase family 9 protein n=1 Tax=Maribacter cobaltidurans TaxID=1178778 RepID=A0ABU7IZI8_9FLAO|nr:MULTISPECIES: glycosyltransferase family 9 protein [Maribacter]MDC6390582.1 glycosyltransferase family 9 protein [Maribacter sp. PR1]MEE1977973.1 glycosyltransferase family 9 protein [Maribacter cobaltidurans]